MIPLITYYLKYNSRHNEIKMQKVSNKNNSLKNYLDLHDIKSNTYNKTKSFEEIKLRH